LEWYREVHQEELCLAYQSKFNRYTTLDTNEREIKMTLTPNELLAMVASVQSDAIELDELDAIELDEIELDENDMQCALAEYEHYEDNWEDIDSDDGHRELYED